ncbi:NAD(P)-binding protein [Zopfia rhizophila CBS 207.26]|uniref:NAD(P)-binding protein n=1 Tax=Zopfia rhizophila CBS 207.26 TaxID=1314779 RepID=A0A6A6ESQ7_9PEZI|nr:NAD(P)-binding protein [Zopfia rhizophila CBS 207.26]
MASQPKILITGATGYIGGSILSHLLTLSTLKSAKFFALIRNPTQAPLFQPLGVEPHARALVLGLGDRLKENPNTFVPHIIHTSGTSNLADRPFSVPDRKLPFELTDLEPEKVYETEKKLEEVEPYLQRTAELVVIDTGIRVGIKTHVIMSPTIYGEGSGPGNKLSIQIPNLVKAAIKDGFASVVGDGTQEWDHVHIDDLTELYGVVLQRIVEGKSMPSGKEGILFSETGRHSWGEVAKNVAEVGAKLGKLNTTKVKSVSMDDGIQKWNPAASTHVELGFASNSRTKSEKAKEWGWKPSREEGWKKAFEEDWRRVLDKEST